MRMSSCTHAVITCIDHRLIEFIVDWMREEGILGDCDPIELAGGALNLVHANLTHRRGIMLEDLALAVTGHGVTTVHLQVHTECGKYQQLGGHEGAHAERRRLELDLREAALSIMLDPRFEHLEIVLWVIVLEPDGEGTSPRFDRIETEQQMPALAVDSGSVSA
jgi:hypothetical protein